jgi:O-antigen/teichoic acid export membrane protein
MPVERNVVERISKGPAILFAALMLNNGSAFAFHATVSRILGPSSYGALGSVLALTLLLTVLASAISVAVVRQVVTRPDTATWDLAPSSRQLRIAMGAVALIGLVASPGLAHYLHLHTVVPPLLLTGVCVAVLGGVVRRGLLLGQHRYREAAAAIGLTAVARIGLGAPLAGAWGVSGGLLAYFLAEGAGTGVAVYLTRARRAPGPALRVPRSSLGLAFVALAGMWILAGTDQFVARHLLSASASGMYVAASTAASIALWLPYNMTLSYFPTLAGDAEHPSRSRSFGRGLLIVSALAGSAACVMAITPGPFVAVLFGSSYRAAAPVLRLLAIANAAQGIASYLIHHQLANHRRTALLSWLAQVATVAGIYVHHRSAVTVAAVPTLVSVVFVAAMTVISFSIRDGTVPATPRNGPEEVAAELIV